MFTHSNILISQYLIDQGNKEQQECRFEQRNNKSNLKNILCIQLLVETQGLFTKINHALGYKASLINFKDSVGYIFKPQSNKYYFLKRIT